MKKQISKTDLIVAAVLVICGVLSRTVFHLGANVEFITAISLLSGYLFRKSKLALAIPLLIMILSDSIIGNTAIFIFTWSGFLFPMLMGRLLGGKKLAAKLGDPLKLMLGAEAAGVVSTLFFFLWTNFGSWLSMNMYSKDLSGLLACYINGLPFLRPQLGANLILVPLIAGVGALAYHEITRVHATQNRQANLKRI